MSMQNHPDEVKRRSVLRLSGRVIGEVFQFDCGFKIPVAQIDSVARLTGVTRTEEGDTVSFDISAVKVTHHEHRFICLCGKEQ